MGIWDADFFVKVDDDVHVNLGAFYFFDVIAFFQKKELTSVYHLTGTLHMEKQECLPLPLRGIKRNQGLILAAWSQAQFLLTSNVN